MKNKQIINLLGCSAALGALSHAASVVLDTQQISARNVQNARQIALKTSANRSISDALRYEPAAVQNRAAADTAGFLAPQDVSIAGAKPWQNEISIAGANIASSIDPAGNKHLVKNIWRNPSMGAFGANISPSLLGSLRLQDAGISASEGFFMGGQISAELRDPRPGLHMQLGAGFSTAERAYIDPALRNNYKSGWGYIDYSNYLKQRYELIAEHAQPSGSGVIFAYSGALSEIKVPNKPALSSDLMQPIKDQAHSIMLRGVHTSDDARAALWMVYAPTFTKTYIESVRESNMKLDYSALLAGAELDLWLDDWQINQRLNAVQMNASRLFEKSAMYRYAASDFANWGSDKSATIGGQGELVQKERKISYRADFKRQIDANGADVLAEFGVFGAHEDALYEKRKPWQEYSGAKALPAGYICAANDPLCVNDSSFDGAGQFLSHLERFAGAKNKAQNNLAAAYVQASLLAEWLQLRLGLRAEYDSLSARTELAPRARLQLGSESNFAALAVGRYYGRSLLSYALFKDIYAHYEELNREHPSEQFSYSAGMKNDLLVGKLARPYSDEIALSAQLELNDWRLKSTLSYRSNHREIATLTRQEFGGEVIDELESNYVRFAPIARSRAFVANVAVASPRYRALQMEHELELSARFMRKKEQNYGYRSGRLDAYVLHNNQRIKQRDLPAQQHVEPFSAQLLYTASLGGWQWFNALSFYAAKEILLRGYDREAKMATYDDFRLKANFAYDTALSYTHTWGSRGANSEDASAANARQLQLRLGVQNVFNQRNEIAARRLNGQIAREYAPARAYSFDVSYKF